MTHEEIREVVRDTIKADGYKPAWMTKGLPIIIAVLGLCTGSLGLGFIKGVFVLSETVTLVKELKTRVTQLENEGTPPMQMQTGLLRQQMSTVESRVALVEQSATRNDRDHAQIMADLAVIKAGLTRWEAVHDKEIKP